MKQSITLLLLLFCTYCFSQIKSSIVIDSIVYKTIHETEDGDFYPFFEVDSFDINGLKRSSFSQGGWILSDYVPRITWDYNLDGKVISKKRWVRNNGFKLDSEDDYQYNADGRMCFHSLQMTNGFYRDTLIQYDSLSRLKSIIIHGKNSGGVYNSSSRDFYYFGNRLTKLITSKWSISNWITDSIYSYFYATYPFPDTVYFFTYNNGNLSTSSRCLVFKNDIGYDSACVFQIVSSSLWINTIKQSISRNQNQQITSVLYYDWNVNHWQTTQDFNPQYWNYNLSGLLTHYGTFDIPYTSFDWYYNYDSLDKLNLEVYIISSMSDHLRIDSVFYSYKRLFSHPLLESFDFSIYPNPASINLSLLLFSQREHSHSVTIYNSLGQLILSESIELSENYSKVEIPIVGLSKGLYFLSVSDKDSYKTKKFLIDE